MNKSARKAFHLHSSYWTNLRWLERNDAHHLHDLAVAVGWPHRPEDMVQLLKLGKGVIASDEIGRAIGTGMYLPMGEDFSMIGMMTTRPRLQAGGMGREILNVILEECGDCRLRLNSTTEAWKLYRSAGFQEEYIANQYQGIVAEAPSVPDLRSGYEMRAATAQDLEIFLRLDRRAFDADRRALFSVLLERSDGMILEKSGEAVGYALSRNFGRGRLIGPLVAPNQELAIALAAPFVRANEGKYLRVDTSETHLALGHFLSVAGLRKYDIVTAMVKGQRPAPEPHGGLVYCLASQAMG